MKNTSSSVCVNLAQRKRTACKSKLKLNLFCYPFENQGYSIHASELLRALCQEEDFDVACISPIPFNVVHSDLIVQQSVIRGIDPRPVCAGIKLDVPEPRRVATFSGSPRIFYTMTEVDKLSPDWVRALNTVDEVWTTSDWGRNIFIQSGVTRPVRVVPEGVDARLFERQPTERPTDEPYRFLTIGKLEERKNYAALFRAYCEEFGSDENVELVVHFGAPLGSVNRPIEFLFNLNLGRHAPIKFSPLIAERQDLVSLYHTADAFVLPTRGEGWGLPIIEAMSCALPVITTGIGPILDYASKETALLLDYKLVQAGDSDLPFFNSHFKWGRWAEPNVSQLRAFMRRLFQNRAEGREIGRRGADCVRAHWTWQHAVLKFRKALQQAICNLNIN